MSTQLPPQGPGHPVGIVLAAGAGSRMGLPKALVGGSGEQGWLRRSVTSLTAGGCRPVVVVLGAAAAEARLLVEEIDGVLVVVAADWEAGQSASLAAGLEAAGGLDAEAAVITLVDLPDVGAAVVARVLARLGTGTEVAGRAVYRGRPGHPVVLGRDHWAPLRAGLVGDQGARDYLGRVGATGVECADLATGADVDQASDL